MADLRNIRKAKILKAAIAPQVSVAPLGSDPLNQVYDEESGSYIPDRKLIPLTLVPTVLIEGSDASGGITSQGWYEIQTDGSEKQITSSTAGFSLVASATGALRLKIMTNTPGNGVRKFIYKCSVSGIQSLATVDLRTDINARPGPTLEIDAAGVVYWNPFDSTQYDVMTITPTVHAHGHANTSVRWLKVDDGITRAIVVGSPEDIECTFDGDAIKVDRRWMGGTLSLICQLLLGNEVADQCYVNIKRRIPDYEADIVGGEAFAEGDTQLYQKIQVKLKPGGVLADPSQEFTIPWYEGNSVVGYGNAHTYNIKGKDSIDVGADIKDKGPLCLFTINGEYLTVGGTFIGGR